MLEIRPNFFIVGAPKCGTTSLDEYLRQHPNVFISRPKEPHYFSTDLNNRVIKSFEEYISLYKSVDPDKHIAIGEASASYLFSKNALINIKKFNPKAKIIVMLRKQIDLLPSYHSQMIAAGQENILDFETAWNAEKQRIKGKKIPFACKEKKVLEYSKWGLFSDQIKRLFSLFSKDQIKIIMFDEFKNNPKKVFGEIIHFLNLKNFENITFDRHNENKTVRNIIFQQVLIFFPPN